MIGAWRGMGDPLVVSPIICKAQHRLALRHRSGAKRRPRQRVCPDTGAADNRSIIKAAPKREPQKSAAKGSIKAGVLRGPGPVGIESGVSKLRNYSVKPPGCAIPRRRL
jgi:hypothetical protein